ncbi:MAG: pyridoxamine 5'-phosphate oxidase family protein [Clostridia bacterium]|nr:pyridoxamine 5'-phosphate oxidase family protein [Clostridia bacterium]
MERGRLRRQDRAMDEEEAWALLERAFCGRLGTVDEEGWPYVVPQLFVVDGRELYFHGTAAYGQTRRNIEADPRVCFEVDEPGPVFPYGEESPCETSVGFESVILFGTCRIVTSREEKIRFYERLMAKYADPAWERPAVWPRLEATTVYAVRVEKVTGKRRPVQVAERWRHLFPQTPAPGARRRR